MRDPSEVATVFLTENLKGQIVAVTYENGYKYEGIIQDVMISGLMGVLLQVKSQSPIAEETFRWKPSTESWECVSKTIGAGQFANIEVRARIIH